MDIALYTHASESPTLPVSAPMQAKLSEARMLPDVRISIFLHAVSEDTVTNQDCLVLHLGLCFICCLYPPGYVRIKKG